MTQETAASPPTPQEQRTERIEKNREFLEDIRKLYEPQRGRIAVLKRNAGNTMAEARGLAWFHFYLTRHFPGQSNRNDNLCLLVASLMTLDRETMLRGLKEGGNFGETLSSLRSPEERAAARPGQTPLERRLVGLLDATFNEDGAGEMAYRLRQAVKFALSKGARIHWPLLLEDMRRWNSPAKNVQKDWARKFYHVRPDAQPEPQNNAGTPAA